MPRARPLDPRSQRQLANLRAQFLYCEQQVLLVSSRVKLMETLIQQQQQLTSVYSLSHYHTHRWRREVGSWIFNGRLTLLD